MSSEILNTHYDWLAHGIKIGFCSPPFCDTHDGAPLTAEEEAEFDDGLDPCIYAVRLFASKDMAADVKAHNPRAGWDF